MEPHESQRPELDSMKSKIKRFQPIWRIFLISNLGLAAYMFATARKKNMNIPDNRTAKKDVGDSKASEEDSKTSEEDLSDLTLWDPEISDTPPVLPKQKEPIPDDQQLELFKWMLEEKRKATPKDHEEKKRIDEDKAILKQFIRAESTPKL